MPVKNSKRQMTVLTGARGMAEINKQMALLEWFKRLDLITLRPYRSVNKIQYSEIKTALNSNDPDKVIIAKIAVTLKEHEFNI